MSTKNAGAFALLVVGIILLILWTIFGYATLIAAFASTTGAVQIALGVYIIGSVLFSVGSMVFRSQVKKRL